MGGEPGYHMVCSSVRKINKLFSNEILMIFVSPATSCEGGTYVSLFR